MKNKPTVIDLFCGCGGLSYGFIEAGYDVLLGIDHWKDAIVTFENTLLVIDSIPCIDLLKPFETF